VLFGKLPSMCVLWRLWSPPVEALTAHTAQGSRHKQRLSVCSRDVR
jgi:hypothetical protein